MNLLRIFRRTTTGNIPSHPVFPARQMPEAERLMRTPAADTQLGYILDRLAAGKKVSSLSIFMGCTAVKPTNRISEARRFLSSMGITMRSEWVKGRKGARFKRFHLDYEDMLKLRKRLRDARKQATKRRAKVRGGRS